MNYSRRQLYALGEPLGDSVTQSMGGKRIYGGGGSGGGGPTTSTVTQSNIPDYLRPQVEMLLGGATQELFTTQPGADGTVDITGTKPYTPYSTDPSAYVAPFSSMQQQAMQGTAGLQTPGQFQTGSQLATQAGVGGLDVAQQAMGYGGMGLGYGGMGAGYGGLGAGYGQLGAQFGQSGAGYGDVGAGYGQLGAQYGDIGSQFGQQGAGYGSMAAGLAPQAQRAGAQAAGIGGLGLGAMTTGADVGSAAYGLAGQQAGAGGAFMQQAMSPQDTQALMSPYMQAVVDQQQQAAQRQSDIARQSIGAQFAKQGAFGGSRFGIQQGQAAADLARLQSGIQAQGLQSAFADARGQQQFGASLGLQGLAGAQQGLGNVLQGGQLGLAGIDRAMAGQQARLQGLQQAGQLYGMGMQGAGMGIQGAQAGMQGAGMGIQGAGMGIQGAQAGMQGAGMGIQGAQAGMQGAGLGLQGVGTGLQGLNQATGAYGLAGQMGGQLGQLGGQQLQAEQSILGQQSQMGALEQQQQQNVINQAIQNYAMAQQAPMERLQQYNALLRGYALPGQTVTQYQAPPPMASQLAGLGIAGYGASRMNAGGVVPSEGIDKLALRRALAGA